MTFPPQLPLSSAQPQGFMQQFRALRGPGTRRLSSSVSSPFRHQQKEGKVTQIEESKTTPPGAIPQTPGPQPGAFCFWPNPR